MSEKSLIRGWSIVQGDYLRDPQYDDEFIKTKAKKKTMERLVFSFSAVMAIGSFVGLMSYITTLIK